MVPVVPVAVAVAVARLMPAHQVLMLLRMLGWWKLLLAPSRRLRQAPLLQGSALRI